MNKKIKWTIVTILSVIFLILLISVYTGHIEQFDNSIYKVIEEMRNENLTKILIFITHLGGTISMILITTVLSLILICFKRKKIAIGIFLNLLISSCTYILLKNIITRPRPAVEEMLVEEIGFSFPSGHTTNNMAFYGFAIYLVYKNVKNKILRNFVCIIFAILAILVGFSRMYLRVHYPSDVLAGFCLGIILVILFETFIYSKINE